MAELDGTVEVVGPGGPVPFLDLFQGRDELVVYKHMWYDGAPHQGQCEGCTTTAWHLKDAVYLNARGVSLAILTTGRWDEVASYVEFMGYTQPWYSVRDVDAPVGGSMGYITCFLRDGDRVFLTYSTTGRGNERVNGSVGLLDMTPYGRGEAREDKPEGWPRARVLVLALGRGRDRHLGPVEPPRAAVSRPARPSVEILDRYGHHHGAPSPGIVKGVRCRAEPPDDARGPPARPVGRRFARKVKDSWQERRCRGWARLAARNQGARLSPPGGRAGAGGGSPRSAARHGRPAPAGRTSAPSGCGTRAPRPVPRTK